MTEQAYAEIKRRILTLEFKPGEFLNETTIRQLLGLGRTPVHEALHRLRLEGLVEIIPRKGIMIRAESLKDVISLIEARMIVEPQCMRLAAERAQAGHLAELADIMKRFRQALADGEPSSFMELDSRFHRELVQASSNPVLSDVMRLLHERASRIWHLQLWGKNDLRVTMCEHDAIYQAVQRGDPNAAYEAALAHLTSLKRRILSGAN